MFFIAIRIVNDFMIFIMSVIIVTVSILIVLAKKILKAQGKGKPGEVS